MKGLNSPTRTLKMSVVAAKASTFDAHTDNPTVVAWRVGFVLPDSPLSRRIAALRMLWITSPSLACLARYQLDTQALSLAFSGSTTSVSS